jgi:SLT domain-containing protein
MINRLIAGFNSLPGPDLPFVPTFTVPAFAQGGLVSRPTLAMVGEGGEREYIVPESKMATASSRFLAGSRGADVIPSSSGGGSSSRAPVINITTGPVLEFDGQRYVRMEDLEKAMRVTADGVIGRLRTPAARIALGRA